MAKQITIKKANVAPTADDWVVTRDKMKHFTFSLSASLHTQFKTKCSSQGKKMGEVLTAMIEDFMK